MQPELKMCDFVFISYTSDISKPGFCLRVIAESF
jgi:hypothetical protein